MNGERPKNRSGLTEEEYLVEYDAGRYDRPSVTADMIIFALDEAGDRSCRKMQEKALKVLMIRRGDHPYIGLWALPGGFVNMDESLETAALRELKEETGIDGIYAEQLYTWGDTGRDPRTRVISSSYMAVAGEGALNIKAGDDAADAGWFTVSWRVCAEQKTALEKGYGLERLMKLELLNEEETLSALIRLTKPLDGKVTEFKWELVETSGIAFDHAKIIGYAVERLRSRARCTDIVFGLMPEAFTLTRLQKAYEAILGEKFLKANFRRKVARMVVKTGETIRQSGHRPSGLFRYNPDWRTC